jgi:hypothetical protein
MTDYWTPPDAQGPERLRPEVVLNADGDEEPTPDPDDRTGPEFDENDFPQRRHLNEII